MKKSWKAAIFAVMLFWVFGIVAGAAVECDGIIKGYEWNESTAVEVIEYNSESGCNIKYLLMKYKYIEEDRRLYVSFYMLENKKSENPLPVASCVSVNNGEEIVFYSDGTEEYNKEKFSLEGGALSDENNGTSMELNVVFKELEYDSSVRLNVRFIDSNGMPSKTYKFDLKSDELLESEKATEKESKTKKARTTKAKSKISSKLRKSSTKKTKEKLTADKTTQMQTVMVTEEYKTYGEKLEKSNKTIAYIGSACLLAAVAGYVMITIKHKK